MNCLYLLVLLCCCGRNGNSGLRPRTAYGNGCGCGNSVVPASTVTNGCGCGNGAAPASTVTNGCGCGNGVMPVAATTNGCGCGNSATPASTAANGCGCAGSTGTAAGKTMSRYEDSMKGFADPVPEMGQSVTMGYAAYQKGCGCKD